MRAKIRSLLLAPEKETERDKLYFLDNTDVKNQVKMRLFNKCSIILHTLHCDKVKEEYLTKIFLLGAGEEDGGEGSGYHDLL